MLKLEATRIDGDYCTLEPLSLDHLEKLNEAVEDGEIWKVRYAEVPKPEQMKDTILHRLELQKQGSMIPFTVISKQTGKVAGMTSYSRIDAKNRRLDIGWTWYAKSYWRTALNTECKLRLLCHAFEALNCIAVGFKVDYLNHRSKRAVERLGAKLDGLIRNYSILPDGNIRDMYFYSIIQSEWPHIKTHLESLLIDYQR